MDANLQSTLFVIFVIATSAWLGAVAATAGFGARVRAVGDADQVVAYASRFARITTLVALPAACIVLASGGAYVLGREMTIAQDWWIGTALGAWIVAMLGSTLLRAPQLSRAVLLAGEHGAEDEDVRWRIRQVTLVVRGELLLLSVAALVLIIQPA